MLNNTSPCTTVMSLTWSKELTSMYYDYEVPDKDCFQGAAPDKYLNTYNLHDLVTNDVSLFLYQTF